MQIKFLKNIVVTIAGSNSEGLVDILYGKKNVNEFIIAKRLNLNINQARNILYRLSDEGLVSFIRKKDKKNGGWYTYFWTFDVGKSLYKLRDALISEIKSLEDQLQSRQTKRFYICPECDMEMNEENALIHDFTCPECGEVLLLRESKDLVEDLRKRAERLRVDLDVVNQEIEVIEKKGENARKRKMKTAEKKKSAERAAKRAVRKKEKQAEKDSQKTDDAKPKIKGKAKKSPAKVKSGVKKLKKTPKTKAKKTPIKKKSKRSSPKAHTRRK